MSEHAYQLAIDPALVPSEPLIEGAMTWAYEGQATFSDEGLEPAGLWWTPSAAEAEPDATFGVGATRRFDALGRQWVLTAVDLDALAEKALRYDAATLAMFGAHGLEPAASDPDSSAPPRPAEPIWLEPTATGSKVDCSGETHHWNITGAAIEQLGAPLGGRSRKVLFGVDGCSATLIDEGWALTAAHCVMAGPTTPVVTTWCTLENLDENISGGNPGECAEVDVTIASPAWALGSTGPEADYALLSFDGWEPGVGYMPVSGASDGVLESHPDFARGFPSRFADCSSNKVTNNALTTNDDFDGDQMFRATGDVKDPSGTVIEYDTSTAKGMSGGPHYYCPTGACGDGHYLTGVQTHAYASSCTGSFCLNLYSMGPKGPAIRSWILAVIP